MKSLLQTLAVLVLLFVIVCFAVGWMTFHQSGPKATIEIDTGKMRESAEQAVEKGKELLEETDKALRSSQSPPDAERHHDRDNDK